MKTLTLRQRLVAAVTLQSFTLTTVAPGLSWAQERDGGREDIGERKKWLVLARIRRVVR